MKIPMRPFANTSNEGIEKLLAAYTASYGRIMTEEEAIDCKKTIELIHLELKLRSEEKKKSLQPGSSNLQAYFNKWF